MVDDVRIVLWYRYNSDKVDERFVILLIIDKRGLIFFFSFERLFEEIDSFIICIFMFGVFGYFFIGILEELVVMVEKLGKFVIS